MESRVSFDVEQAGCSSCAELVRSALEPLGSVDAISVDEAADTASVTMSGDVDRDAVAAALDATSAGSGHSYRVRPGSWRVA